MPKRPCQTCPDYIFRPIARAAKVQGGTRRLQRPSKLYGKPFLGKLVGMMHTQECCYRRLTLTCISMDRVNKMRTQKKKYEKGEDSSLSYKQIALLIDIGFAWGKTRKDAWEEKFRLLEAYKNQHGHCNVPTRSGDSLELQQLGRWVSRQRELYKFTQNRDNETSRELMSQERFMRLKFLGFQWSASQSSTNIEDGEC